MTAAPGYSDTPLPQKLGLRDGQRVLFIALPPELNELRVSRHFAEMAQAGWGTWQDGDPGYDFVHGFATSRQVLDDNALPLMQAIDRNGTIWISWPKKASKVETDITEDVLRATLLKTGWVDNKVCAIDDIWSGLRFVMRKENRPPWKR